MKSSQEMTKEILELESQISTINKRISDFQERKAQAEQEHYKLIQNGLKSGDLEKDGYPGPGDAFAKALEHGLRADALRKARMDLEAKLDQAKSHLDLARLYESIIPHFEEIEPIFMDNLKAIELGIKALNERSNYLSETINDFMQEAGNPLDAIESLTKNPLMAGLSLKAFFAGEIRQATPNENDDFIASIGRKYLHLANALPKPRNIEDSWKGLSNRLDALARQAQGLVPSRLKYIPVAPSKQKPEIETGSTIRIPIKPPPKKLSWAEKKAKEERRAAALFR